MVERRFSALCAAILWLAGGAWAQSVVRSDLAPRWKDASGQLIWPKNDGCDGPAKTEILNAGVRIDRYGGDYGTFFALPGTPYAERAMPYETKNLVYHIYVVLKPLSVSACKIAPWFGEPGGGEQFKTSDNVMLLKSNGEIVTAPGS